MSKLETIGEKLFELLSDNAPDAELKDLKTAMDDFRTNNHRSLNRLLKQPAFETLWSSMDEAIRYRTEMGNIEAEDAAAKKSADRVDGFDRDDLGESPDR